MLALFFYVFMNNIILFFCDFTIFISFFWCLIFCVVSIFMQWISFLLREPIMWLMTPSYYRVMQKSIIGILMSHYLSMTHQLLMYWNKITGKKSKVSTLLVQSTAFVWASVLDKCKIAETNVWSYWTNEFGEVNKYFSTLIWPSAI